MPALYSKETAGRQRVLQSLLHCLSVVLAQLVFYDCKAKL